MNKRVIAVLLAVITLLSVAVLTCGAAQTEAADAAEASVGAEVPALNETAEEWDDGAELAQVGSTTPPTEAQEEPAFVYPLITGFESTAKGVTIKWSEEEAQYRHRVYYKNGSSWKKIAELNGKSCTDTSVTDGTRRVYTLRRVDENGAFTSDFNRAGWEHVFYDPPEIASLTATVEGVSVKWKRRAGAQDYRVYRKTTGSWTRLTQTDGSEYLDTAAVSGVKYTYTIRMVTPDGVCTSGHTSGKSISFVAAPTISKIENTDKGAKLTWIKPNGADRMRVYYHNGSGWTKLAQLTGTTYTDTSVKNGEKRRYTLRCLNAQDKFVSDFYREGKENTYFAVPVISSLSCAAGGVSVKWNRPAGAQDYRVYRKTAGGWEKLTQTDGSEYLDTTAVSGNKYTYTIRMISEEGVFMSAHNSGKSISYVAAPEITGMENLSTGVRLTWDAVEGAQRYRVYYKSDGGWTRLSSLAGTTFTDTSVADREERCYTVRCVDSFENFVSDFYRDRWYNTFYAPPEIGGVALNGSGETVVTWEDVAGVAAYRLYRKEPGGAFARLPEDVADAFYIDAGALEDHVYTYTLRYLNEEGDLISGYTTDTLYYVNGELADGDYELNGKTYHIDNGVMPFGFRKVDGKRYYYNSTGKLVKNNIVGSDDEGWFYADKNGVICESEEICLAAEFMMRECTGSTLKDRMKDGFMKLAGFPYSRSYDHPKNASDVALLAGDLLRNRSGNCYRYATAFACLAKIAGYRTRVGVGITTNSMPHGWTEVYVDGEWLYCDVDANLPNYQLPDYAVYFAKDHRWEVKTYFTTELEIDGGEAYWR